MRKTIGILLCILLCGCLCLGCFAESFTGVEGMRVILTADGEMESNLAGSNDHTAALEPGDDITYTVQVMNQANETADWFMLNRILNSLEDRSSVASGGAYSYRLSFETNGEETVFFDSDTVGGVTDEARHGGLHDAGDALRDYFYFGTLAPGQTGTVTLHVALDGESQGNMYQDTLADLQLSFAAALLGKNEQVNVVKTGDDTLLFPFFVAMGVSGLALLGILLYSLLRKRRKGGKPA